MLASRLLTYVVAREAGTTVKDLPIYAVREATILDDGCPKITKREYKDGVFLLENVLTKAECDRIVATSEGMGFKEDAPVSLGRDIRKNENVVWIQSPSVNDAIFDRVQSFLPPTIEMNGKHLGSLLALNRRWRLYKYQETDVFKFHTDGAWTGSGVVEDDNGQPTLQNDIYNGGALSWLTFLIYLNDDFEGGATSFLTKAAAQRRHEEKDDDEEKDRDDVFHVTPKQGAVLCFFHGYHDLSLLHEGAQVIHGTKYVARSDVLYALPEDLRLASDTS